MKAQCSLLLLAIMLASYIYSPAQKLNRSIYTTDGPVYASYQNGDTLYIGGSFTQVGYGVRALARYLPNSGVPDFNFIELDKNNSLYAVEPDGNGGYYLGGILSSYLGQPLGNGFGVGVIHILADYSLDPNFELTDLNGFYILTLNKKGNRLYIGGHFYSVDGIAHENLAALNATTGKPANWFPDVPDGEVNKIVVSNSFVFIGGSFFTVGAHNAQDFAALDINTGKYTPYYTGYGVNTIDINNNILFLGGNFTTVGIKSEGTAVVNTTTGDAQLNYPETDGTVNAILDDGSGGYYIAGGFSLVGSAPRTSLAHILADGTVDPAFNVTINGGIYCLATDGTNLYFGGSFNGVNDVSRSNIAAVNLHTGMLSAWNPIPNDQVITMVYVNNTIYIGGTFTAVNSKQRLYAAAISAAGNLKKWAPDPDYFVNSLAANTAGTSIFIGGGFFNVHGSIHHNLAKVDNINGIPAAWDPGPDGTVNDMVLKGSKLYIGGEFINVNGIPRQHLAQLDTAFNNPTSFQANTDNTINKLAIYNNKLYVGGTFASIQNTDRSNCARIDLTSQIVDAWKGEVDNYVWAILPSNDKVVLGGGFKLVNLVKRNAVASISLADNKITGFNIRDKTFAGSVSAFAFTKNEIFVGGPFTYSNGIAHYGGLAAFDTSGFNSRFFNYTPDIMLGYTALSCLAVSKNQLYAGGTFSSFYDSTQTKYITRVRLASYDLNHNKLSPIIYNPNWDVTMLQKDAADNMIVGGGFSLLNYKDRANLAAIDLQTGVATNWYPVPAGKVNAIAVKDTSVFIGGEFTGIYDSTRTIFTNRQYVAAINTVTSQPSAWNADANSVVNSLSLVNSTLYMGGYFTIVKGSIRNHAAAVSTDGNGIIKAWDPDVNSAVNTMLASGDKVYMGGTFTTIHGATRNYLAAVNNISGAVASWKPNPDNTVNTLTANRIALFVGGSFTTIASANRQSVASFALANNSLLSNDMQLRNETGFAPIINALALSERTLFIGSESSLYSSLDSIHGTARHIFGAADIINGTATAFDPNPDNTINSATAVNNRLFVGGQFYTMGTAGPSASYFCTFDLDSNAAEPEQSETSMRRVTKKLVPDSELLTASISPNPVKSAATLYLSRNTDGVNIIIRNVSGEIVYRSLNVKEKYVHIPVTQLSAGMYFIEIKDSQQSVVIKMIKE